MSVQPPPIEIVPTYNSQNFNINDTALNIGDADLRYLQLTGGVETGLVTFNAGLNASSINTSAFKLPTGAIANYVLSSDAMGNGTWSLFASPPAFPIYAPDGSALLPTYSFATSPTSGIFTNGADLIDISCAATLQHQFGNGVEITNGVTYFDAGSVSNPSISFQSGSSSGLWHSGGNLRISNAATLQTSFNTTNIENAVPLYQQDGLVSAPSYSFVNNPTMGMFRSAANTIDLATNGISQLSINTTGISANLPILASNGLVGTPSMTFASDLDTGLYSIAGNSLGVTTNGVLRLSVDTTSLTPTLPIYAQDGLVGAPSYSFVNNPTMGFYRSAANTMVLATNGVARLTTNTTNVTSSLAILSSAGTAALPSLSFSGDSNTGVYSVSSDALGITTGGSLKVQIDTTALTSFLQVAVGSMSLGTPSYSFNGDNNTGMYSPGADQIGFSCGNTSIMTMSTTTTTIPSILRYTGSTPTNGYILTSNASGDCSWVANSATYAGFADGSLSAPGIYFSSDTNTGIYRSGSDSVTLVGGGVGNLTCTGSQVVVSSTATFSANASNTAGPSQGGVVAAGGISAKYNFYCGGNSTTLFRGLTGFIHAVAPTTLTSDDDYAIASISGIGQCSISSGAPARTITDAYSLYIAGEPLAAGTATVTNPYALGVLSGKSRLQKIICEDATQADVKSSDGAIKVTGGVYIAKNLIVLDQPQLVAFWTSTQTTGLASSTSYGIVNSNGSVSLTNYSVDSGPTITQSNGVFTVTKAGMYAVNATITAVASTSITRVEVSIGLNGSTSNTIALIQNLSGGSTANYSQTLAGCRYLANGDSIQLNYRYTFSGTLSLPLTNNQISIVKLW